MRIPTSKPGPKPRLSRDLILRAAIDADEEISIASLAEALDCSTAALYRHVDSRDDIVVGAVDIVIAQTPRPDPATAWRPFITTECDIRWGLYMQHAVLFAAWLGSGAVSRSSVERNEWVAATLVGHGFDWHDAAAAVHVIVPLLGGYGAVVAAGQAARTDVAWTERLRLFSPEMRAVEQERMSDLRGSFSRELGIFLDGLAGRLRHTD